MLEPIRSIPLAFARLDIYPTGVTTVFIDGTEYSAHAHHTREYVALADWLGYQGDIAAYCLDHELLHEFLQEELFGRPSRVLWALAHDQKAPAEAILAEEALTILAQAYLRGALTAMPATAPNVDWRAIKSRALDLLATPARQEAA
jgi:hypothetical protein